MWRNCCCLTCSDMMNIEQTLTFKEKQLLSEVRSDCQKHTDLIIDNGYTGAIKKENLDDIVRSSQVSFVSCRCLYMKEFMLGLSSYGLDQMIIQNPLVCQPLFCCWGSEGRCYSWCWLSLLTSGTSLFTGRHIKTMLWRGHHRLLSRYSQWLSDGKCGVRSSGTHCKQQKEEGNADEDEVMNQHENLVFKSPIVSVYQGSWAGSQDHSISQFQGKGLKYRFILIMTV